MPRKPLITVDSIRQHLDTATSRADLLRAIGVAPAARNYQRLDQIAALWGLALPVKNNNGRPGSRPERRTSALWDEKKLRAAMASARSLKEVAANLGLTRNTIPRLRLAAEGFGVDLPRSHGGPDATEARAAAISRVFVKGVRRVNGAPTAVHPHVECVPVHLRDLWIAARVERQTACSSGRPRQR